MTSEYRFLRLVSDMMNPLLDESELDESELAEFELACNMGELYRVRGYLESDYRDSLINMRFANGDTPLLAASISMRYPLVEYLLSCGADPNISDSRTIAVLHGAVASRSLLAMQVFLAYGARTEMRVDSELGLTALHGAVIEEWEEGLQLLIECGADINAISSMGATALCIACCQAAPNRIIELLLDGHASPELRNERGLSALHICVTQPDRLMKIFIERGVSLEIRNAAGQSVLHFAVLEACASMCKLLLSAGADIESVDSRERTMLMTACKANRPQAVEFLLKKGVTVDDRDYRGRTAFHYAAQNLSLQLVRMLVESNAEWTIQDDDGRTAGARARGLRQRAVRALRVRLPRSGLGRAHGRVRLHGAPEVAPSEVLALHGRAIPLDLHGPMGAQRKARRLLDMQERARGVSEGRPHSSRREDVHKLLGERRTHRE